MLVRQSSTAQNNPTFSALLKQTPCAWGRKQVGGGSQPGPASPAELLANVASRRENGWKVIACPVRSQERNDTGRKSMTAAVPLRKAMLGSKRKRTSRRRNGVIRDYSEPRVTSATGHVIEVQHSLKISYMRRTSTIMPHTASRITAWSHYTLPNIGTMIVKNSGMSV